MRFFEHRLFRYFLSAAAIGVVGVPSTLLAEEWLSGYEWAEPKVITPGEHGDPPSDAVVLFGGKDLSAWNGASQWTIENGVAICGGGGITTKDSFGSCQLHIEWSAPTVIKGEGQGRGNSGVYFMGKYEVQILDSYNNDTYYDGQAAAIYKQSPPMVNPIRPPGEWNVYDIIFNAPSFKDDGTVQSPAALTVLFNGVVVQNHFELLGGTYWHQPPSYDSHPARLPITIQDHGNPVRFRNIWVREITPIAGKQVYKPHMISEKPEKVSSDDAS